MKIKTRSVRLRLSRFSFAFCIGIFSGSQSQAQAPVPAWLTAHIGLGSNQIAPVVLARARAFYLQRYRAGAISNSCYLAMDATRPNERGANDGRFYIICETTRSFRVLSAGHGSGRKLPEIADYSNELRCAKNFGNALDSELTSGGSYITAEAKTSFKGYYLGKSGRIVPFSRTFLQFDGVGESITARVRAIGGHAALTLKNVCLRKDADSPYADQAGYVPFGKLVDYTGGRSNGCTSWSERDADQILRMVKDSPTTLYIYPSQEDIEAVAHAKATGSKLTFPEVYWNKECLAAIRTPRFWSREDLEPLIQRFRKAHPLPPPQPAPVCK